MSAGWNEAGLETGEALPLSRAQPFSAPCHNFRGTTCALNTIFWATILSCQHGTIVSMWPQYSSRNSARKERFLLGTEVHWIASDIKILLNLIELNAVNTQVIFLFYGKRVVEWIFNCITYSLHSLQLTYGKQSWVLSLNILGCLIRFFQDISCFSSQLQWNYSVDCKTEYSKGERINCNCAAHSFTVCYPFRTTEFNTLAELLTIHRQVVLVPSQKSNEALV